MADDKQTGLAKALDLDGKAAELSGELRQEGEEKIQHDLFAGSSVFGTIVTPGGETVKGGPGRPKGSRNRSTRDLVKLIEATGKNPIIGLAEVVAMPIDAIAATLGCKKIEAAEFWRKCANDLAPYVAQKLPIAIDLPGANAGVLAVFMGAAQGDEPSLDQVFGQLIEGNQEMQQNQQLSEADDEAAHDEPAHDEDK